MRYMLVALCLTIGTVSSADAQVSVGFGVDIGIRVPTFPELVLVPGYPVYYDPRADSNYFFYDGVYWVYADDSWYASSWYNGPWQLVRPERVPLYVLRVPVRYYRQPPPYFHDWRPDAPPRWGQRWGRGWERHHPGWDRWDRRYAPRPAPLPAYQREYSGDRYPRGWEQQRAIRSEQYRYRPREAEAREHFSPRGYQGGPRGEPQRPGPGPGRPPERGGMDRGGMRGPDGRGDGRMNGHDDRGRFQGGPRAEPQHQGPGPQQPERRGDDRGQRQQPERRGDDRGHDGRRDERGPDRHDDRQ